MDAFHAQAARAKAAADAVELQRAQGYRDQLAATLAGHKPGQIAQPVASITPAPAFVPPAAPPITPVPPMAAAPAPIAPVVVPALAKAPVSGE
jgi:hypothetical protein